MPAQPIKQDQTVSDDEFLLSWENLVCAKQLHSSSDDSDPRNPYEKDYDKIIFCAALRRLARKTQVHPLTENDHVHNRLTHTLEVASVGRCLGRAAGDFVESRGEMPVGASSETFGSIVQAASLAHDIGNTPFGHAGEYAIRQWMTENRAILKTVDGKGINDFLYFEGNAQGFRTVAKLEGRSDGSGLRLTSATLGSMIKYPWFSNSQAAHKYGTNTAKFNFFRSEELLANRLAENLGIPNDNGWCCRHPLSYLMEAADDICYGITDVEDALTLGIIQGEQVRQIVTDLCPQERIPSSADELVKNFNIYRSTAIGNLIKICNQTFAQQYSNIMNGTLNYSLLDHSDSVFRDALYDAKALVKNTVYPTRRKTELELGCYSSLEIILTEMMRAAKEFRSASRYDEISFKHQKLLTLLNSEELENCETAYETYMTVTDFVSGMTDNHATHIANQLSGHAK